MAGHPCSGLPSIIRFWPVAPDLPYDTELKAGSSEYILAHLGRIGENLQPVT
jgi:hypothetical protein